MALVITAHEVVVEYKGSPRDNNNALLIGFTSGMSCILVPEFDDSLCVLRLHDTFINQELMTAARSTARRMARSPRSFTPEDELLKQILSTPLLKLPHRKHTFVIDGFDHLSLSLFYNGRDWHVWDSERIMNVQCISLSEAIGLWQHTKH